MTLERTIIATSLKLYFSHERTMRWVDEVAATSIPRGIEVIVLPSFLAIPATVARLAPRGVSVGGQNLFDEDWGPFTGEVSAAQLREAGCAFAEIGHSERERLFGETEHDISRKLTAAWRNDLCPILCIGEPERLPAAVAAQWCADKLSRLLDAAGPSGGDLVVAYEPVWAIGASVPAAADHVATVAAALRAAAVARADLGDTRVIYGGTAGPGDLARFGPALDGLFLGRLAHIPSALARILEECEKIDV